MNSFTSGISSVGSKKISNKIELLSINKRSSFAGRVIGVWLPSFFWKKKAKHRAKSSCRRLQLTFSFPLFYRRDLSRLHQKKPYFGISENPHNAGKIVIMFLCSSSFLLLKIGLSTHFRYSL